MKGRAAPVPGSRGFVAAIVAAQVLTQIGAFTLPALLPGYIERWHLSKTEAGWLVGIFFAAYVPAVPVLLALTDRMPARRIYLVGTGLTALSHLGFALVADGFWSGLAMRALAGVGWAGAYMPGLKAIADEATCGTLRLALLRIGAQVRRSVRRIKLAMASAHPFQNEFALAHARLTAVTAR